MTTPDPVEAIRATLPEMDAPLEIDWPELHAHALGCGLEDRNIHDRYEAAEYGWQDGVDKAIDRVPEQIFNIEQVQARETLAIRAALDYGGKIWEQLEKLGWQRVACPACGSDMAPELYGTKEHKKPVKESP